MNEIELKEYNKEYYKKNKEKFVKARKKYYEKNKEKLLENQKEYIKKYRHDNKNKIAKTVRKYKKNRLKIDIEFKIGSILRTRICLAIKRNSKSASTMQLIGCDIDYFMYYLQKQFTKGMSWDNHGSGKHGKGMEEWHIDHIKPCASFDLSKPEEQRKCFHYTNLQPLWATLNRKKYTATLGQR